MALPVFGLANKMKFALSKISFLIKPDGISYDTHDCSGMINSKHVYQKYTHLPISTVIKLEQSYKCFVINLVLSKTVTTARCLLCSEDTSC